MSEKTLNQLADEVVIANATGCPDLYRNAVANLIAGVRASEKIMTTLNPIVLEAALKVLRLHGFAVVHYGGDVLHQAVGAPTNGRTWRDDLARAAESITHDKGEQAWRFAQAVEASLFDLNKIGTAGVAVSQTIADATSKAG